MHRLWVAGVLFVNGASTETAQPSCRSRGVHTGRDMHTGREICAPEPVPMPVPVPFFLNFIFFAMMWAMMWACPFRYPYYVGKHVYYFFGVILLNYLFHGIFLVSVFSRSLFCNHSHDLECKSVFALLQQDIHAAKTKSQAIPQRAPAAGLTQKQL